MRIEAFLSLHRLARLALVKKRRHESIQASTIPRANMEITAYTVLGLSTLVRQ